MVITKSSAPQSSQSIKEHIAAKIAEKKNNSIQPLVGSPITDCNDPEFIIDNHNSKYFGKKVKDTPTYKTLADSRKHNQENLDAVIAKAKVELVPNVKEDLDLIARDSQRGYVVKGTFTSWNHKTILPTGCPDKRIQNEIGVVNTARMERHEKPYLSYSDWYVNDPLIPTPNDYGFEPTPYESPKSLAVATAPVLISKYSYYVAWHNNQAYYLADGSVPTILKKMSDEDTDGRITCSQKQITQYSSHGSRDLTKAEFDNIVASSPSPESLFSVYNQFAAPDIRFNVALASVVFAED